MSGNEPAAAPPPMPASERERIAAEMEGALRRHVMDAWFPRCLAAQRGGYLCNFDRKWRPGSHQPILLEFQARQTRTAARLALACPQDGGWAEYALHGFRFLRDVMWDAELGGWYWRMDSANQPGAGATKHAHSGAYATQACALVYQATGESAALELAQEAFAWYDRYAHHPQSPGYDGWLRRDGRVIRSIEDVPAGTPSAEDPLGHGIGLKDVNTNGDWFEALSDFWLAAPSRKLEERLRELGELYLSELTNAAGEIHYAFHRDWSVQPGAERFGYSFQGAKRLAREGLPLADALAARERAGRLVEHANRMAPLPSGGYRYAGPAGPPRALEGQGLSVRKTTWWVQFEALPALALVAMGRAPADGWAAGEALSKHWAWVRREMFDHQYGGVYDAAPRDLRPWRRPLRGLRGGWALRKGDEWKDASHETDSLLEAIALLRA